MWARSEAGLSRLPVTEKIAGSNPVGPAKQLFTNTTKCGIVCSSSIPRRNESFMKKKIVPIVLVTVGAVLLLSGCAEANQYINTAPANGDTASFLQGIIQGFIIVFAFIGSLFDHSIGIYEVHNDGTAYNIGYVIGIWLFFGGGTGAVVGGSRSRRD
jgi:hypothetical protein